MALEIELQNLPTYNIVFSIREFFLTLKPLQQMFRGAIYLFEKDTSSNDSAHMIITMSDIHGSFRGGDMEFTIQIDYMIPMTADHVGVAGARAFISDYVMLAIKRNEIQFANNYILFPTDFSISNNNDGSGAMYFNGTMRYGYWTEFIQNSGIDFWDNTVPIEITNIEANIDNFTQTDIDLN